MALSVLADDDARSKKSTESVFTLHPVTDPKHVLIDYTNWRRQRAERVILPTSLWFGTTEQHPKQEWMVKGFDVEKKAERDFTLRTIHYWG